MFSIREPKKEIQIIPFNYWKKEIVRKKTPNLFINLWLFHNKESKTKKENAFTLKIDILVTQIYKNQNKK